MENNKLPSRKSVRAIWHDYNCGFYFVTVCTHNKVHALGHIYGGNMHLSLVGKFLDYSINQAEKLNDNVDLINYIIMPNHFHLIVRIGEPLVNQWDDEAAQHNHSQLSKIITGIKAYVTRCCNISGIKFSWQRSFHDIIITSAPTFSHLMDYIDNNVNKWCDSELE